MSFSSVFSSLRTVLFGDLESIARLDLVRWASKKTSGSSRNRPIHRKPKRRRILCNDGCYVQSGTILVKQLRLRYHPGLNVGFGKNGTLFALESGRVVVTCEQLDPRWDHTWIERIYPGRMGQTIYKKFFNIIPDMQVGRFKLIDEY